MNKCVVNGTDIFCSVLNRWFLKPVAVLFFVLSQTSFADSLVAVNASMVDMAVKRGTLKVAVSVFEPWTMKSQSGELIGFNIDIAKKLAKDLGIKLELVSVAWPEIISTLQSGLVDVIIGGMSITTPRNLKVNFTIPYSHSLIRLVANRKRANGLSRIEDYNKKNITLALRAGTSSVAIVHEVMPEANIVQFDDHDQALQAVLAGKAHATLAASPLAELSAARFTEQLVLPDEGVVQRESEAFAIRKGDADSLNVLNNWILINLQNDWLQDRHDYWLTSRDWQKRVAP